MAMKFRSQKEREDYSQRFYRQPTPVPVDTDHEIADDAADEEPIAR